MRVLLNIAITKGWSIRHLDINNAFLQGTLYEDVYMSQPPGFVDKDFPTYVCKLKKAIYGLRQASRAWYHELRKFLLQVGFHNSKSDSSLIVYQQGDIFLYLLVYVDDIILTGSSSDHLHSFVETLSKRFSLKDLGTLSYFLGIEIIPNDCGILLSQKRYILDLLARTNMLTAKPVSTPLPSNFIITKTAGTLLKDPKEFRMVVGSLQYLLITRPEMAFAVNKLSQYMQSPTTEHWSIAKRLLRYLRGTTDYGVQFHKNSPLSLHAYSDADWGGNKEDWSSNTAFILYLGKNPISWCSKKQRTTARSSTEAEYRAVAATAADIIWVCNLLRELNVQSSTGPVIYCDNVGATQLSANPVFHSRMKHLAIDYYFVRELVQKGYLRVVHVNSQDQLADIMTKSLTGNKFQNLRDKIGVHYRTPS